MQNRKVITPPSVFSSFSTQVLVQPQIIKTDSLVLTTLKTDGSPVMATVQNPALTALTTPIQTAALQVPVRATSTAHIPLALRPPPSASFLGGVGPQRGKQSLCVNGCRSFMPCVTFSAAQEQQRCPSSWTIAPQKTIRLSGPAGGGLAFEGS